MPDVSRGLSTRRFAAMLFRAAPRATLTSIVLMVLVVNVRMFVLQRLMHVVVIMRLRQVQP